MRRWRPVTVGLYRELSAVSDPSDDVSFESAPRSVILQRVQEMLTTRRQIRHAIGKYNPQIIHTHFLTDAIRVVPVAHHAGIPVVITVHGFDVTRWHHARTLPKALQPLVRSARRRQAYRVLSSADQVIAVSEMLRERVIQLGANPAKTVFIPMGVVNLSEDLVPPSQRYGVVFVGRLVEVKGVADVITAWSRLPFSARVEHPLTIIGDGPLKRKLELLAISLGAKVDFQGSQPPKKVSAVLSRSAVFCGGSRTAEAGDTEGFGIVFLEAAAHELPVVAYHHGGVPEAVKDGETGLLAPEGDIDGLSARLQRVLLDPALRDRLGIAGRQRVRESFDVVKCTAQLEDLYETIVADGPSH